MEGLILTPQPMRTKIGFLFSAPKWVNSTTALENIAFPLSKVWDEFLLDIFVKRGTVRFTG